ncbi:MAG: DEAD/DEAH box helicase, partial [Bifidobacteriaceae bacterium]|nr:DEAD/DEAH box helicase [Bifidobacteriaceae bacterium]
MDRFAAGLGFPLDPYQREACLGLAAGESVLVAAPTGAGKTAVALFGIDRALGFEAPGLAACLETGFVTGLDDAAITDPAAPSNPDGGTAVDDVAAPSLPAVPASADPSGRAAQVPAVPASDDGPSSASGRSGHARPGRRAFYTTPIKALSNQKFRELSARYGAASVGLLTGDQSIRPNAPVVVMTTEVLRNMLYADSTALAELDLVVLDEVHYLADRFRGPVWEEVAIQLPQTVQVVALSATVSNAEEFGEWLSLVRGSVRVVVSDVRPVPLWQHVLTPEGLKDL